jgi:hypothetical protein
MAAPYPRQSWTYSCLNFTLRWAIALPDPPRVQAPVSLFTPPSSSRFSFVAVFTMRVDGRAAYDDNGYLPFVAPLPIVAKRRDVNITACCVLSTLLIAGPLSNAGASTG